MGYWSVQNVTHIFGSQDCCCDLRIRVSTSAISSPHDREKNRAFVEAITRAHCSRSLMDRLRFINLRVWPESLINMKNVTGRCQHCPCSTPDLMPSVLRPGLHMHGLFRNLPVVVCIETLVCCALPHLQ